ncbi:hypothetical protein CVT24_000743 [Panaeolus cyanescens]|uniref:Uncharacterized protein n=1 Tax=Panaeolus cyanescens TaxID=181874 RepID=A0A409WPJ0_9AGAR|nr:hypothetical protein CVT24_000743 [Panaeolus cyanescens]
MGPLALSTLVLDLEEYSDTKVVLEKWIAYASKTASATANGYVQTLRVRNIGKIEAFQQPDFAEEMTVDERTPEWYLAEPSMIRVGTLLARILMAIPNLYTIEWHSNDCHPMNHFLLDHFKQFDLIDFSVRFLAVAGAYSHPEDRIRPGRQDAFKGLRSLSLNSWYNSDYDLLGEWVAETIRHSPELKSLTVIHPVYLSTDSAPSLKGLFPLPTDPEGPPAPLRLEHLSISGLRASFDDPEIISHLRGLRSIKLNNILYGPPLGVLIKDLWQPLLDAGIFPEKIELNLTEVEHKFLDYLLAYPPRRLKSLVFDNRDLLHQDTDSMNEVALRFYGEVLKKENIRDSLEELTVYTKDRHDNWGWDHWRGMVQAIEECKNMPLESVTIGCPPPTY